MQNGGGGIFQSDWPKSTHPGYEPRPPDFQTCILNHGFCPAGTDVTKATRSQNSRVIDLWRIARVSHLEII